VRRSGESKWRAPFARHRPSETAPVLVVAPRTLEDNTPKGAAASGQGHIFVNIERTSAFKWTATAFWPPPPWDEPDRRCCVDVRRQCVRASTRQEIVALSG
jgi:hypothetical protein